jgi:hypothetical protein
MMFSDSCMVASRLFEPTWHLGKKYDTTEYNSSIIIK